jgi:hypothetical protein
MIATAISLAMVAVVLAGVLVLVLRMQAAERREWVAERRALVDRAIAQHVGEIVTLDRTSRPREVREPTDRPQAVGLG